MNAPALDLPTIEGASFTIGKEDALNVTVKGLLAKGDLCDVYSCVYSREEPLKGANRYERLLNAGGVPTEGVFKVSCGTDNDLVENETAVLTKLYPPSEPDQRFYRYLPRLLASATLIRPKRRANLFPYMTDYITVKQILEACPQGIDFRDLVWMFKRTLVGAGFAHEKGFVHGALLPPHILVHPIAHGAKLVDWSYAVEPPDRLNPSRDAHIRALSIDYADYYPPEVIERKDASPATDIYMIAKCAVALLGGNVKTNAMPRAVPPEIQGFLKTCLASAPNMRPPNAWDLHEEFDDLLLKLVGKPKYRPFSLPGKEAADTTAP